MKSVVAATAAVMLLSSPVMADDSIKGSGVRNNVWSVGMTGKRHSLKAGDGNELLGNSAAVQLGKGYISESWYASLSLDILLGPYEPTRNGQLNVAIDEGLFNPRLDPDFKVIEPLKK